MDTPELTALVRERAHALSRSNEPNARENGDLLLVLARILEGHPVVKSLGYVGDWGWDSPVGKALLKDFPPTDRATQLKLGLQPVGKAAERFPAKA